MRRRYILALALLAFAGWPAPARARCQGRVQGPCASPEPAAYLPGGPDVVVTNFGLLFAGDTGGSGGAPGRWQLVCDDSYELAPPARVRRTPDGRLFAPRNGGLAVSADGCSWTEATGAAAGQTILEVAFDPADPGRVWALTEQLPPALLRSDDGGARFAEVLRLGPETPPYHRLVLTGDGRLYLFGRGGNRSTPSAVSTDGGRSFTAFDLSAGAAAPPATALDYLASHPGDPLTLYFQVFDPTGDELWQTSDGGTSVRRLLKLATGEVLGGLAFGPGGRVLYVGSANPFPQSGAPAGHLHVSRDAGTTWQAPVASGPTGPRYRCLAHAGGRLYACGAGEILGDAFLIGVSDDEGQTWQPHARLTEIAPRACVRAQCLATTAWLCQLHGRCSPDAGALPDAAPDAGAPRTEGGGCSCTLHNSATPPLTLVWVFVAAAASRWRRRASPAVARARGGRDPVRVPK